MKERVYQLLNIKVSESRHVFDLLSIQFFIGIAHSFTTIAAFTYFIYEYSITGLPYVYLAVAGTLLLTNIGYQKLEHKFPALRLLMIIILLSMAATVLFWSGLAVGDKHTMIFLLLIWSVLFYMITGYSYWGLVSLLFNIRESKRVFSIVGAGDIPAKLVGYLSTPFIVPLIGLNNILLLSLVSLGVGLFLTRRLIKKNALHHFAAGHDHGPAHAPAHHGKKEHRNPLTIKNNFFVKNKLVLFISLLSLLSYNVFNLIDYTFIYQIKLRYDNISALASFIAVFFAGGRVVAMVLKVIFSSRVIERIGVISSLNITPTILLIFSILFISLNNISDYSLYVFGIMALLTEVLRSTIQEPSFFILFQPLPEQARLKGHIIAKGYMLPPSLIVVGTTIIILNKAGIELTIPFTIGVLLVNLMLWFFIVFFIRREYISTLHSSIRKGVQISDDIHINDHKTIDILLRKVDSPKETENIYALKLLESSGYHNLDFLLRSQLKTDKTEVRRYALSRLEEREAIEVPVLKEILEEEKDQLVREQLISLLLKRDAAFLKRLSNNISENDYETQKSVITHLLDQVEFDFLYKAGKRIHDLLYSKNPKERELALEIISELKNIKFTAAIERLMSDPEPNVRRSAILGACKMKNARLLPKIMRLLDDDATKFIAIQGLFFFGDDLFREIKKMPGWEKHKNELQKVAAKVKGSYSTDFLLECLQEDQYSEKLINALWTKGFQAERVEDIHLMKGYLKKYLDNGNEKIGVYSFIHGTDNKLLKSSVLNDIKGDLITSLKVCSMLYGKKELNRVIELVEHTQKKKLFNAMEMLEWVVPKNFSRQINSILDYLLDPAPLPKAQTITALATFYNAVLNDKAHAFNSWTKAICLYTSLKNNQLEVLQFMRKQDDEAENAILLDIKNHFLHTNQTFTYVDN